MTVSTTTARVDYTGNGVTVLFSVPFPFIQDDYLQVLRINASTLVSTTLVLDSAGANGYTVAGAGNPTGSVTVVTPPSSGERLAIVRVVPATQEADFVANDPFPAETFEDALDKLTMIVGQAVSDVDRALKLFPGDLDGSGRYDANGNRILHVADGIDHSDAATVGQLIGAGSGNFIAAGTGAVTRTMQNKARDIYSVKDFGAVGDGVTDDHAAFVAAIAAMEVNDDYRGRTLFIPAGKYKINGSLDFTSFNLIHGAYLEGEGIANTFLDFSGAPPGTDGITFNAGAHFSLRNLFVANAPNHNIVVSRGMTVGGANYSLLFTIENIRTQGAGEDGLLLINAFQGTVNNVWATNNGNNGITLAGFHTSMNFSQCYALLNGEIGFSINGTIYSTFTACASDQNAKQGYAVSNARAVVFTGCGAESNQRDGWLLVTDDSTVTGIPTASQDIYGVEFVGCYAIANSLVTPGLYATFIGASTNDSRPIAFAVRGGDASPATVSDASMILAGTSGRIKAVLDEFDRYQFSAADAVTGNVLVRNDSVLGLTCRLQTSGSQSIANTTDTVLNWNTTAVSNTLGAGVAATTITVPRGVNRVRVSVGVAWDSNSTGARLLQILRGGPGGVGLPVSVVPASGFSQNTVHSALLDVVEGEAFSVRVNQSSGGPLGIVSGPNNGVWFCMEAVG